jgi:hypothetical protein
MIDCDGGGEGACVLVLVVCGRKRSEKERQR